MPEIKSESECFEGAEKKPRALTHRVSVGRSDGRPVALASSTAPGCPGATTSLFDLSSATALSVCPLRPPWTDAHPRSAPAECFISWFISDLASLVSAEAETGIFADRILPGLVVS